MKTIATFMNTQEAHLFKIKLEGLGISAMVVDDVTASVAPYLTNAIGGVRVQILEEDFEKARAVIQVEQEPSVSLREGYECPNCGSTDIDEALHEKRSYLLSFLILFFLMLPFPIIKRRYRCASCDHLWK